jgi:hypothetical protein
VFSALALFLSLALSGQAAEEPAGARKGFGILLRWLWRYTEPATGA